MRNHGLTLTELLITLAIVAILATQATPFIQNMLDRHRVRIAFDALHQDLSLARNHAIQQRQTAIICTSTNGQSCEARDWHQGRIVFLDYNRNLARDNNEPLIASHHPEKQLNIVFNGFRSNHMIRFYPSGGVDSNGRFFVCNQREHIIQSSLVISRSGRIRLEERAANAGNC